MPQPQHHPTDADPPEKLAGENGGKHADRSAEGKCADAHGRDREAIEDQRGSVIREAFAFEDDGEASRKLHSARDGERRHGVRRRNNGAQSKAHRPGEAQQPVGRRCNREHRERDASYGEKRDWAQIEAEFAPAHRHGRRVNDRGQHEKQHELRGQLDPWQARDKCQSDAGDYQQNGQRNLQSCRKERDRGNHDQEKH